MASGLGAKSTAPLWHAAVEAAPGGTRLRLELQPGSATLQFPSGYQEWRKRLQARVPAPARDGKANQELLELLAEAFGIPVSCIALEQGASDRRKTVLLEGLDSDAACSVLERLFAAR